MRTSCANAWVEEIMYPLAEVVCSAVPTKNSLLGRELAVITNKLIYPLHAPEPVAVNCKC